MRLVFVLVFLAGLCAGCALPASQSATALPTTALQATAAPTAAPKLAPTITVLSATGTSIAPAASFTRPAATATLTANPVPTLGAPQVVTRFSLNDLAGEGRGAAALALLDENIYVANRGTSNIGVISGDRVQSFIPLDAAPSALAADAARNRIYAGSYVSPTIMMLENDRVTRAVTAGGRVNALALDGDTLYVALDNDAVIERYDAGTLEKRDELKLLQGFGVSDLVLDKPRNRLYAGVYGKIVAIDLSTFQELESLPVPYLYSDFAVNPADGSIWSGAYDESASRAYLVGFSATGQEIARLYIGSDLNATTFDDAGRVYVLDRFANQVHVVQTPQAELVVTVALNEAPSDAVYDPTRHVVWVSSQDNDNVAAIGTTDLGVVRTIPLANNITALEANPARKRVYAANASTNSVYVIENNKVVGQVKTGIAPVDIAIDPDTARLYVASRADGEVTLIDEDSLEIVASQFITRALSTVAMDSVNRKLFAGPYTLDPQSLLPQELFFAHGLTLDSQTVPQFERPNPALQKLYALASNGVPGSNSRLTLFRFLYDDRSQSKLLGSGNSGNTTALAIDPSTNNLFATNFHPLGYISGLDVFDAEDNLVKSLPLISNAPALVVNPETKHLFIAFAQTYQPIPGRPTPQDDTVQILDTVTLGLVGAVDVPGEPTRMTRLDGDIYVASAKDGRITVIRDVATNQPPAPTPTPTPSPYTTARFTAVPTATLMPAATATPAASAASCEHDVLPELTAKAAALGRARIGCPLHAGETSDKYAFQPFAAGGLMVAERWRLFFVRRRDLGIKIVRLGKFSLDTLYRLRTGSAALRV